MPSGYPDDPLSPNKPLIFAVLDEQYRDPRRRWESLKLHRLLKWLWDPDKSTNAAAAKTYIGKLKGYGPLGQRYADLNGHVRLSRVPELLGQLSNDPATTRAHVDEDWFGGNGPFQWLPEPTSAGRERETLFLDAMIAALDASLGLQSVEKCHPDNWADDDHAGSWPPLANDPKGENTAPSTIERLYARLDVEALVRNRPIDFYSVTDDTPRYEVVVARGPERIIVTTLTPGMVKRRK